MRRVICVGVLACAWMAYVPAVGQEVVPYPQPGKAVPPAVVPAPAVAAPAADAVKSEDHSAPNIGVGKQVPVPVKGKTLEAERPNTVVVLPAQPMLDEEGKQRLDPDGKPMFYAPVQQLRDKKGRPVLDEHGKPVMQTAKDLGYDEAGKKIRVEKEKKVKATPLSISRGVLTVDGLTGKAALNYDIADLRFIYIYAPGIGVTLVSHAPFAGAKEQPGAFEDKTLTVSADGHVLQVASDKRLLGKKPEAAFVRVDREFTMASTFPVVGYGGIARAPYAWPGAKPNEKLAGPVEAPPIPKNLLPVQLQQPCPAGQMRPAVKAVPGVAAAVAPCVAIAKAVAK